jgi:hypothetical protein
MQDVGEHMDELFRKAADNYMLKEGESNWSEISGQLESSFVSPVLPVNKNIGTRKYLMTGILLLLCFAAGILFNKYTSVNKALPGIAKQQNNDANADKVNENVSSSKEKKLQQDKVVSDQNKNTNNNNYNSTSIINQYKSEDHFIYTPGTQNNITHVDDKIISSATDFSTSTIIKNKPQITPVPVQKLSRTSDNKTVDINQSLPKDSASTNTAIKLTAKYKRGMYYGLLAGVGFTTVKSQSFTRPGFDVGVIAGYQISPRSSVEINLLYTHKYYYSDGKYFSMDKMKNDMPADMKLMSVKSNSSIFEIPLKFRYNIIQKNNNAVYASAGISSYILVNEKNNYVTSTNGTMGNMQGNYTNTSAYFAGAFNISAGYAYTTGKNNTIRFEPYVTIPLKGIGMGDLPVTTSGVHVLFTIAPHR